MSDSNVNYSSSGFLPALLFVLFLGLKLGHVIDWSWWWIFAPLWIPAVIVLGIIIVVLFIFLIVWLTGSSKPNSWKSLFYWKKKRT